MPVTRKHSSSPPCLSIIWSSDAAGRCNSLLRKSARCARNSRPRWCRSNWARTYDFGSSTAFPNSRKPASRIQFKRRKPSANLWSTEGCASERRHTVTSLEGGSKSSLDVDEELKENHMVKLISEVGNRPTVEQLILVANIHIEVL